MTDLKETSELMRSQSNRGTQYPLFVIQNKVKTVIYNHFDAEERELREDFDRDLLCEECIGKLENDREYVGCDECDEDVFFFFNWDYEFDLNAGVFFTEKACHDHIAQNDYHYHRDVRSYVIGAWRNPEMVAVMQSLLDVTGEPNAARLDLPSCYK